MNGARGRRIQLWSVLGAILCSIGPAARADTGRVVWDAFYDGAGKNDQCVASALSPDGSTVFVTGWSWQDPAYDQVTVAYAASDGHRRWDQRYDGPAHGNDYAVDVAASPDGKRVYAIATSYSASTHDDLLLTAMSASDGHVRWVRRSNGSPGAVDRAIGLVVSPDGSAVFAVGVSEVQDGPKHEDYFTVAYSSHGERLWTRRYNSPASANDEPAAIAVNPDGSLVYVTGWSDDGPNTDADFVTLAYDAANGTRTWTRRYDDAVHSHDRPSDIAVSPDGARVFVTGYDYGAGTSQDLVTKAYDATDGAPLWMRRYNDDAVNKWDIGRAVRVSHDGRTVFVTGYSEGPTAEDVVTAAYGAAHGKVRWLVRYNAPADRDDEGHALAVDPGGKVVYVLGETRGTTTYADGLVLAYDTSDGAPLWSDAYNDPGNGYERFDSGELGSDGARLYGCGPYTQDGNKPGDYLTVGYATS